MRAASVGCPIARKRSARRYSECRSGEKDWVMRGSTTQTSAAFPARRLPPGQPGRCGLLGPRSRTDPFVTLSATCRIMGAMASTRDWFETVAEAQERARKRLPRSVYLALVAGTEKGLTSRDNELAFDELGFRPHVADLPEKRELATTVMGQDVSLPVLISPTGVQAVHPDGEVAVARAAAAEGTAMGLSSFASKPVEDVTAANDKVFFQMYWAGDRDRILARAERARAAGAKGLIITLDWSFATRRDWDDPPITEKID